MADYRHQAWQISATTMPYLQNTLSVYHKIKRYIMSLR